MDCGGETRPGDYVKRMKEKGLPLVEEALKFLPGRLKKKNKGATQFQEGDKRRSWMVCFDSYSV
jgi:hypothetical protein